VSDVNTEHNDPERKKQPSPRELLLLELGCGILVLAVKVSDLLQRYGAL
jgi:hypothetical protein